MSQVLLHVCKSYHCESASVDQFAYQIQNTGGGLSLFQPKEPLSWASLLGLLSGPLSKAYLFGVFSGPFFWVSFLGLFPGSLLVFFF